MSTPVGSAIAGQFQQGQMLEGQVQMQANKCYTVIGVGLPPVQNLDIQLAPFVPIAGMPAAVVAQDQTVGPQAIIGEKATCYRSMLPMPMKVIVSVSQGSGVAAVQRSADSRAIRAAATLISRTRCSRP